LEISFESMDIDEYEMKKEYLEENIIAVSDVIKDL
jgi:hypothetical protein